MQHKFTVVFEDAFCFVLVSLAPGGPGEGPDCHSIEQFGGCYPIPAQIRGKPILYFDFGFKRSWDHR